MSEQQECLESKQDKSMREAMEKYAVPLSLIDDVQMISDTIYDITQSLPKFGKTAEEGMRILACVFSTALAGFERAFAKKGGSN